MGICELQNDIPKNLASDNHLITWFDLEKKKKRERVYFHSISIFAQIVEIFNLSNVAISNTNLNGKDFINVYQTQILIHYRN